MSTNRTQTGRLSPAVYRRRRLVVLLGLVAVIVAIVLVIVRPGSSQGDEKDSGGAAASTDSPTSADASAAPPQTVIPTEQTAADGAACEADQVLVEAVTDKSEYQAGEQPQLSVTITNTGRNVCVLNAGTSAQAFTIKSGEEVYWTSTDCQTDPVDAEVSLTPGTPVSSAAPINWDRTRSAPDTCDAPREAVPAGGASYHLSVTVDGIESAESKQFLLY
ncbi:hypothetical protein ACWKWP_06110 [Agromyces soli]